MRFHAIKEVARGIQETLDEAAPNRFEVTFSGKRIRVYDGRSRFAPKKLVAIFLGNDCPTDNDRATNWAALKLAPVFEAMA